MPVLPTLRPIDMANPRIGLRLTSSNGAFCPGTTEHVDGQAGERRSSLTVDMFCAEEEAIHYQGAPPVLKDWALKGDCDLHVSLRGGFACPELERRAPPPPPHPPGGSGTSAVDHARAPHLCACPLSLLQNDVCDAHRDTAGCLPTTAVQARRSCPTRRMRATLTLTLTVALTLTVF